MRKICLLLLLCVSFGAAAQLRLAPILTDNMVMCQSTQVPVWGTAPSASKVRIVASWAPADTIVAKADPSGRWRAELKTPKADNKAHTVSFNDIVLKNVALGEVWIASGQSNMEWNVVRGILDGETHAAAANNADIRVFQVPLLGSPTPQDRLQASWSVCSPEVMRKMSAVGYFFARKLVAELGVPIGVISTAWGGTPAEPWIPAEAVEANEKLSGKLVKQGNQWRPIEVGACYNQMIHPLVPFAVSGAIWYQGESNRENAEVYDELMTTLITSWRAKFGRELPFYFVQIAPFNYGAGDLLASIVREQQEQTSRRLPKTGMVVVSDRVNDVNNIHPLDKTTVGERLAAFALAEVYARDVKNYKSPTFNSVSFDKGKAYVTLNDASCGVVVEGKKAVGMKIAGADGEFVEAEVKVLPDNRLEVYSRAVKEPRAVRYAFDDTTMGNIFSTAKLPLAPFRTDK